MPPSTPREWRVTVRIPDGVALGDHQAHDAAAAAAAPPGWYCVGTIPISPRERGRVDDPSAWRLRITYWPEAWRHVTTLLAYPAVYAAAQIAGVATLLDSLVADHDGIQYRTPDRRPLARYCGMWDGRDSLPSDVRAALDKIASIDRGRKTGHMWARPFTARALALAAELTRADETERQAACALVQAWVEREHPEVLR